MQLGGGGMLKTIQIAEKNYKSKQVQTWVPDIIINKQTQSLKLGYTNVWDRADKLQSLNAVPNQFNYLSHLVHKSEQFKVQV